MQRDDFDAGLAEVCDRDNVCLMAYSVLATGALTGKFSCSKFPGGTSLGTLDYYIEERRYRSNAVTKLSCR